jgi:hypothetical protein
MSPSSVDAPSSDSDTYELQGTSLLVIRIVWLALAAIGLERRYRQPPGATDACYRRDQCC